MGCEVIDPFAISVLRYGPAGKQEEEVEDYIDDDDGGEMTTDVILSLEDVIEDVDLSPEDFE